MNVVVDLACAQIEQGHTVAVASRGGEFVDLLEDHGVFCFELNQTRQPLALYRAAVRFRTIIHEFRPDIVHAHMITGAVLAYLLRWKLGYGLVTTVHNEHYRTASLMGIADRVIAVSDAVAKSMTARGIPKNKVSVVRNGPLGTLRKTTTSEPPALLHPAIVTIGGMYLRKGIIPLLTAFSLLLKRIPSAHLYLVGEGPDRPTFELTAKKLGISEVVHFEGFQADPWKYLKVADVFVLASLKEPFGLVLAEAREAGSAIIATRVGGIPEALDDGNAGILVPPNDCPALAEALCRLLENEDHLAQAKMRALRNLDWLKVKRMTTETLEVYMHAIARNSMPNSKDA